MAAPQAAAAPSPLPQERRSFLAEVWTENREIFKAIFADFVLFLLALTALLLVHFVLRGMENAGYPHERIARFEELHYWAYLGVDGLFVIDLLMKLVLFLFLRARK